MSSGFLSTANPAAERTAGLEERNSPSPRRFSVKPWDQGTLPMGRTDLYLPA